MAFAQIDPTLALGFYCRTLDDFERLCEALDVLSTAAQQAPLLTVGDHPPPTRSAAAEAQANAAIDALCDDSMEEGGDDWQVL